MHQSLSIKCIFEICVMNRMRPLAILAKKILAWHPVNLARDAALLETMLWKLPPEMQSSLASAPCNCQDSTGN